MHKIHAKEFTMDDFSCERLLADDMDALRMTIDRLNRNRQAFLETNDKDYWYAMIQLLPTSYNQKRTIFLNYEVLVGIYRDRRNHKLTEWHTLCDWIEQLPLSELITGKYEDEE